MNADITLSPAEPEFTTVPTAGLTTKVVKGSIWTLIGQGLPLAASLVATPFSIRFLGAEGYGVLILVGLVPVYLSFADFGMSVASTKFASEAYGAGDRVGEAKVIRTAALVALASPVPFAVIVFALAAQIVGLANVPDVYQGDAKIALRIMSVAFVLSILSTVLNTPMLTRLRMDLNALTSSVPKALMLAATPIVLYLGGGIVGAVWIVLAASVLILAGQLFFARRLLPELFATSIDREILRPILKFGLGMVAAVIAVVILQNLEKVLLPALVSVRALAYYSVAFTFASMTSMFASSMVQSLIPAFSQLLGNKRIDEFDALFGRALRLNMIWIPPAIMFLFVIARPFFSVWAGKDFGVESTIPFYVLLAGLLFNLVAYIPYSAIAAAGRTDVIAKLSWIELGVFAILSFVLVRTFGILGAALAWSIRVGFEGFIYMWLTKRFIGVKFNFTRYTLSLIFGVALLAPPMLVAVYNNYSIWVPISGLLFGLLYAVFIWTFVIDADEKTWIAARLNVATGWFGQI